LDTGRAGGAYPNTTDPRQGEQRGPLLLQSNETRSECGPIAPDPLMDVERFFAEVDAVVDGLCATSTLMDDLKLAFREARRGHYPELTEGQWHSLSSVGWHRGVTRRYDGQRIQSRPQYSGHVHQHGASSRLRSRLPLP
jgi:hypothetical protein